VTQKIISASKRIAEGSGETLYLGALDISRDWGWAPEYVEAMWKMLQQPQADDFVIATGDTHTLEEFVDLAFTELGINWRDHVKQSEEFMRPSDLKISRADPSKAKRILGWEPKMKMGDTIKVMLSY
jgi:GDPmannose 4,6-dehydratase